MFVKGKLRILSYHVLNVSDITIATTPDSNVKFNLDLILLDKNKELFQSELKVQVGKCSEGKWFTKEGFCQECVDNFEYIKYLKNQSSCSDCPLDRAICKKG